MDSLLLSHRQFRKDVYAAGVPSIASSAGFPCSPEAVMAAFDRLKAGTASDADKRLLFRYFHCVALGAIKSPRKEMRERIATETAGDMLLQAEICKLQVPKVRPRPPDKGTPDDPQRKSQ